MPIFLIQCANPNAKEKFQQISIAYTKLISAQSIGGKRLEDEDSDDDAGGKRGVESHEMAAFMRMFMDLVGIFNEDQSLTEDGKIPAAGKLIDHLLYDFKSSISENIL